MALASLTGVRVAGIASAVPKQIVSNSDYHGVPPEQLERIIKYTGIQFRRWAPKPLCCSDLCYAAAEKLMQELGWKPEDISVLVFLTQTPDYPFPATAQLLQTRLGLPASCLAFDVNLGCSAYTYGLFTLGSMLQAGQHKRGLVLTGDVSKMHGDSDPASAMLFGHGGSATAMEFSNDAAPMHFELGSDGGGFKVIYVPAGGARNPVGANAFRKDALESGGSRSETDVVLDGGDIINFTLREIPGSINRLLGRVGRPVSEVDHFVFHQANQFINTQVAKKLKISPGQAPSSLYNFGNTSSATIPLTVTTQLRSELAAGSRKLVMSGFGVGLSWASVYWESQGVVCPELIEV